MGQILDTVRHRFVERASPSLQSMAQMEDPIYEELNRCKPEILQIWRHQAKDDSSRPLSPHYHGHLQGWRCWGDLPAAESLNPRASKKHCEPKHSLVTYLTNNQDRMDSPRYEALGPPIGSGKAETQCKTLVQARCKQADMQ